MWKRIIVFSSCCFIVIFIGVALYTCVRFKAIYSPKNIEPINTVILPNSKYNSHGFTITGMAYDCIEDCFWAGNYGKVIPDDPVHKPSIVKLSRNMEILDELDFDKIELDPQNKNIQGVALDSKENTLWISGGKSLVNISKDGKFLRRITINGVDLQLNGIAYDSATDTLWVLCYTEKLFNLTKDGKVIKSIPCNVSNQDQLAFSENGNLFFTAGADYQGNNNYLYIIDTGTGKMAKKYMLGKSYAVEGICFFDGKLYVANDGYYHNSLIEENLINIYEID